jgi:MraZ protein
MFLGTYEHTLDAKGRLVMPVKFREKLEGGCVITPGQEDCLTVWPMEAFQREYDRIANLPATDRDARKYRRMMFAGGADLTLDAQGRIPIPENLRDWAGIVKDVTVTGSGPLIELWAKEAWQTERAEAGEFFSNISEPLGLDGTSI